MKQIFTKVFDYMFPMCPNGGHRQRGRLVTNVYGNQYCWHGDCIKANFKECDVKAKTE
jgi:hypothetical protein